MEKRSKGRAAKVASMSRRGFLKGGVALGGMTALGGLAGCAAQSAPSSGAARTSWVPDEWDYEADIIAVGAGGAGLAAGVEAGEQGMSIIILESQAIAGGNSAICGGGIAIPGSPLQEQEGIEDSADIMYEDLCAWFANDYYDDYVRLLCDLNSGLYEWLTGLGVEFKEDGLIQSNGHSRPREHHVTPGDVISALQAAAEASGADIQFNVHVNHLVQDPVSRQIVGVVAGEEGREVYYKANKGVLLCSGGYTLNLDMLEDWNFGPVIHELPFFSCSPGQDGSGIQMAMEVGASTRHMSYCAMLSTLHPDGSPTDATAMYHQGAILVNMEGRRFVDESRGYTNVWEELLQQTDAVCYQVWDNDIAVEYTDNESAYYDHHKAEETGLLLQADTLEELAALMEVPPEALVSTVESYNADVLDDGVDSVFGRAHTSGTGATPPALDTPPFYAFKTTPAMGVTYGGIRQDVSQGCQVVDVFGNVIPRLHVAGNISDYCNMGCVPGTRRAINASGVSMGGAMSFGRYCVQQIAGRDSWDAQ